MFWLDKHTRIRKNLSPYIDGQLSPRERTALEEHLATCDACRSELDELRATISAVGGVSDVEPPRSFALTAEMLERRVSSPPAPVPGYAMGMRLAGAAVAVVLAVVLVGDMGGSGGGMGDGHDEQSGALRDSAEESRTMEFLAEDSAGEAAPNATSAAEPDNADAAASAGETEGCAAIAGEEPADQGDDSIAGATPAPGASPDLTLDSAGGPAACEPAAAQVAPQPESPVANNAIDDGTNGESSGTRDAVDDEGGSSALTIVEILLAGSLLALLAGIGVEYALRRRQAA
jgi:anti-sigma factor RsiW